MTSPKSIASDFARFDKIFSVVNPIVKKTPVVKKTRKSAKRKSIENFGSSFAKRKSLNQTAVKQSNLDESKDDLLPLLSCNDFGNLNVQKEQPLADRTNTRPTQNERDIDIFSPKIEEFSEGEEIFNASQEGLCIQRVSKLLEEMNQKKSKFKPVNRVVPGGILEKFMTMKRNDGGKEEDIDIEQITEFRRRLVIRFTFSDDFSEFNISQASRQHFLVIPGCYIKIVKQHSYYTAVFNLPAQEFEENCFVHFGKLIRARKQY